MPNHTINKVRIEGPVGEMKRFKGFVGGKDTNGEESLFTFHAIIPMPQEVIDTYGNSGTGPAWYNWSCNNWGTKWDCYRLGEDNELEDSYGHLEFQTAWCPPTPIFEKLIQEFPDLNIQWRYLLEDDGHFDQYSLNKELP